MMVDGLVVGLLNALILTWRPQLSIDLGLDMCADWIKAMIVIDILTIHIVELCIISWVIIWQKLLHFIYVYVYLLLKPKITVEVIIIEENGLFILRVYLLIQRRYRLLRNIWNYSTKLSFKFLVEIKNLQDYNLTEPPIWIDK